MATRPDARAVKCLRSWERWGWLLVGALAVLVVVDLSRVWRITNHHDVDVFLQAAERLVRGEDIYADGPAFWAAVESGTIDMKDDSLAWPYAYAPLIALLFVPLTWLPLAVARTLWWGTNVVALLAGCWLVIEPWREDRSPWLLALLLALLWRYDPAVVALRLGQIEIVQFLLLAAAMALLRRERDVWAGVLIGLAAGLKFVPAALAVWFMWRRRWQAAGWTLAVAAISILGSFALVTRAQAVAYFAFMSLYGFGGAFAAFPLNQSLNGFVIRNLVRNPFVATLKGWHLPSLARALIYGGVLVIGGACAWLTFHRQTWPAQPTDADHERSDLEFALAIAALAIVSPHSQVYALVWLLVPLLLLARRLWNHRLGIWPWLGLLVGYLLVGRPYALYVPMLTRLVQAHYFFGALLLWGLTGWLLWRRPSQRTGL